MALTETPTKLTLIAHIRFLEIMNARVPTGNRSFDTVAKTAFLSLVACKQYETQIC